MLQHGEAKVLITDREFSGGGGQGVAHAGAQAAGDRHRRPLGLGRRSARRDDLRGLPRYRRPRVRLDPARRRVGRDRAELHLRDHRQPQGRGAAPSRGLPERGQQCGHLEHAALPGLPVDAADVPLQRLVLSVDRGDAGGHQRVPAAGRGAGGLRAHPQGGRDPLLRCAGGAQHADQRPGQPAGRYRSHGPRHDRWRGAAAGRDRGHGAHGLRPHPCLRADRGVRTRRRVREASRVGQRSAWSSARSATAARASATSCRRT